VVEAAALMYSGGGLHGGSPTAPARRWCHAPAATR